MLNQRFFRTSFRLLVVTVLFLPSAQSARGATHRNLVQMDLSAKIAPGTKSVSAIRESAETGSLAQLLAGVMRSHGDIPVAPPSGKVPAASSEIGGLSSNLAGPVGRLDRMVRLAAAAVEEALAGANPEVLRASVGSVSGPHTIDQPIAYPSTDGVRMDLIRGAAEAIAKAIDLELPTLRAASQGSGSAAEAAGCDLLSALPALCVGGDGANTYTADAALLIDLGGNDRYENSAGGASGFTGMPVSVNVDLGGKDTYEQVIGTDQSAGQGVGFYGVGILVDAAGDDTYLQRFRPEPSGRMLAFAQGMGFAGVGLLADLAGDDSYTALPAGDGFAFYQGAGDGYGSTGVLFDAAGDDAYLLDGGTIEPDPDGAFSPIRQSQFAQGFGVFGIGALVDNGGADTFDARASIEAPPEITSYFGYDDGTVLRVPAQQLKAQGVGELAGTGLLLTGNGPTTYSVSASSTGLGLHWVYGQGHSSEAVGVLDDRGGNDSYELSTSMTARYETSGGAGCDCETVDASIQARPLGNPQNIGGQGNSGSFLGNTSVLGLLADHGGDDRYSVEERAVVETTALARDGLEAHATAIAFNAGPLYAQGTGHAFGVGALVDEAGDDVYNVDLHQLARAHAEATDGAAAISVAEAQQQERYSPDPPMVLAQGASGFDPSFGALVDLDGRDAYRVVTRSEAIAEPTPEGAFEQRGDGSVQGSGPGGLFVDQDEGAPDSFLAEPNFELTCEGNRGEPTRWTECSDVRANWIVSTTGARPLGRGFVDSAPTKGVPSITIDSVDRHASGRGFVVRGHLSGPAGGALADRFIDIRLTRAEPWVGVGSGLGLSTRTVQLSASHAFSAADGTWAAVIRIPDEVVVAGVTVSAGFSGDESLRASMAERPA